MTQSDAKSVLGLDPGKGEHATTDVADTCTYHRDARFVSIVVRKLAQATFDNSASRTTEATAISGLAPHVYQFGHIIEFWKSGLQIAVGVNGGGGGNSLAKEKTIVKAAMGRL